MRTARSAVLAALLVLLPAVLACTGDGPTVPPAVNPGTGPGATRVVLVDVRLGTTLGADQAVVLGTAVPLPGDTLVGLEREWYATAADRAAGTARLGTGPNHGRLVTLLPGDTASLYLRWRSTGDTTWQTRALRYARATDGSWPALGYVLAQ